MQDLLQLRARGEPAHEVAREGWLRFSVRSSLPEINPTFLPLDPRVAEGILSALAVFGRCGGDLINLKRSNHKPT
jgi:hypothetical protein